MKKAPKKKARLNGSRPNGRTRKTGVDLAIEACDGSQAEFARKMGVGRALIHYWKTLGVVPASRAIDVSAKTGVPLHKLNPNVYPDPNK